MSDTPERIWTASTRGKCHVGFDTPSMNYTNEYVRADRIAALEAQVAAADRLADAMPGLMDFIERHSNRWDGIIGKHPMEIHMDAIAALAAYLATKEPKA